MPWHDSSACSGCRSAMPGKRRQPFVPLGVVLHGTRPERIEIRVDRHVPRRQIDEVADQVDLADLGQRRRRLRQGCRPAAGLDLGTPARRTRAADGVRRPVAHLEQQFGGLVLCPCRSVTDFANDLQRLSRMRLPLLALTAGRAARQHRCQPVDLRPRPFLRHRDA